MSDDSKKTPLVPVYAKVTAFDEDQELEIPRYAAAVDLSRPYFTVHSKYQHIPEARNLTWQDDFFEDEHESGEVVAVFDLDYEAMESFYTKMGWVCIGFSLLYSPLFMLSLVTFTPCMLRKNVQWAVKAKHVSITRDGIRFVQDRRSCGWGMSCTDIGKSSKTVPFDMITDADVMEPAGNECFCVPRILFKVKVDTASSSEDRHELVISGLKDPHGFKKLVWAMKRAQQSQSQEAPMETQSASGDDITSLLREIRDELRQNNEVLQVMNKDNKDHQVVPLATTKHAQFI